MKDRNVLKNGRPTIAVLAGSMASEYQEAIVRGAAYVAEQRDYNIIAYCGGVIDSPDPYSLTREAVFDLVDLDLISGVISPFSSHLRYLSEQKSHAFIKRFSDIPIVNLGSYIEGYTNVVTDYETGLAELFDHFYYTHGYRNILLIRGPENHASSECRTKLYKQLIVKYGLDFNNEMIIYSDLNRNAAKISMKDYLDKNSKSFDAIIAINDNQALGVTDALLEYGIRVPEDVAVSGSMNTLEAVFATPALTSIAEPLFELGRTATIELIDQIEGKQPQTKIQIPTSLILRQSCGCKQVQSSVTLDTEYDINSGLSNKAHDLIFKDTKRDIMTIVEQYKGGIARERVDYLLELYIDGIFGESCDDFLFQLRSSLEEATKSEDVVLWLSFTSKIQLSTLQYFKFEPESSKLIKLIASIAVLKDEISQKAITFQRYEAENYLNYFRAVVNNLNSSFDLASVKSYTIDILQLSELYISLYDDADLVQKTATNMVAVRKNKFFEPVNRNFYANKLIPGDIGNYHERYSLMVFPLSFRRQQLGFVTVNLSSRKGTAYENLRAIVSSALKNETLIRDLKNAEKRFSDIAHSTSDWLWETDSTHQFIYCSESSNTIIGFSPEELMGKPINELNAGSEEGSGYLEAMLDCEDLSDFECWLRHKNGKVVCLLISAKPIVTNGTFKGYRGVCEDVTEQKFQEEKIKKLAYTDAVTGLPNRVLFQETLSETLLRSAQQGKKFALMFIDLDHFKNVNDSMGHVAGDLLLVKLVKRLKQSIRDCDTLARLGGDEFVVILPDTKSQKDITDIAERIVSNIKEPVVIYDKPVLITLSLGISVYPTDGDDPKSLLQHSDSAMYQAKSQGRNGYVYYDKALEERNILRNKYEVVLREALATGDFLLNYQPQVSAYTGHVVGFEALVRISSPKHGVVYPNHFIPLAEELGLIGLIDEWVFENVCRQYSVWRSRSLEHVRLSVNLSAQQLRSESVLNSYIKILEKYRIEPADLQLEITEHALIDNEDIAFRVLSGFKYYGVSIALDDFGTGHSSLKCISLYPIDTIKIDRSFVLDAVENHVNKALIHGIASIARSLELKVIAEGVETQEQYELLKLLGCNEIQGYYFYKPCSAEDAQRLLEEQDKEKRL
ncbi:EAL domain-containing protein [Vibrio sp. JC009]|uniref:EAL domain-containing protein n=1 Tax=Vibrio sp. JC009 TaxID=2912314 RepID=UPI0023B16947|nr:EAL domain-containing protein [Vibrio sp. JC009]WED24118.1 EAL domain-containing protein [Vibrio sp. JC009]